MNRKTYICWPCTVVAALQCGSFLNEQDIHCCRPPDRSKQSFIAIYLFLWTLLCCCFESLFMMNLKYLGSRVPLERGHLVPPPTPPPLLRWCHWPWETPITTYIRPITLPATKPRQPHTHTCTHAIINTHTHIHTFTWFLLLDVSSFGEWSWEPCPCCHLAFWECVAVDLRCTLRWLWARSTALVCIGNVSYQSSFKEVTVGATRNPSCDTLEHQCLSKHF